MFDIRFKRSAKREPLDLDDDVFLRMVRAILELQESPRPCGYDVVAGKPNQLRIWAGRDHRILDDVDESARKVVIIAVRKKDEATYR